MGQAASALQVSEGHNLSGKVAVITGASSGIGREAAKVLLSRGAHVVMPVRSLSKGEAVKESLLVEIRDSQSGSSPLDAGAIALIQVRCSSCAVRHGCPPLASVCSATSPLSNP